MDWRKNRWVLAALLAMGAAACATQKSSPPKEFLDAHTGATVTVAREAMEFALQRDALDADKTGYVSLTAASVDHSGDSQLYLVGYIWWLKALPGETDVGRVKLIVDGRDIVLEPLPQFPNDLRDRHRLHAPSGGNFREFAYPVSIDLLRTIADSHDLDLRLPAPTAQDRDAEQHYVSWSDSRSALRSFIQDIGPQYPVAGSP